MVEVRVDGEKIELTGLDRPLSLTAGKHGLTVTGADFEAVANGDTEGLISLLAVAQAK